MVLQGSMTALATPFTSDGIDEETFAAFVEWQIGEGTGGLVPCGTTGEGPTLTQAERDRLTRICVECASGAVPVVAGTGTNATAATIERTRAAKAAGADGLDRRRVHVPREVAVPQLAGQARTGEGVARRAWM